MSFLLKFIPRYALPRKALSALLLPLLILSLAPLLSACGDDSATATTTSNSATVATPNTTVAMANTAKSELKVSLFFLNYSLDPKDYFNGWILVRVGAGETLLRLDDNGQVQSALARDFKVLSPLSYELTLQEGIKFSDGSAFTALDVKQNLERVMALNPRTVDYFSLDHIEVPNDHTLVIHTTKPVPEIFANLCEPLFSMVKLPAEALPDANGTWPPFTLTPPVTTGPYMVTSFTPNEKIEVAPNPFYHGRMDNMDVATNAAATSTTDTTANTVAKHTDSRYGRISYFYMPDAQNRIMALQAGEVDLIPTVDYANLELFADRSRYQVLSRLSPRTHVVYLNHTNPLLALTPVRQAISLAINRDHLVTLIGGQAASQLIAPEFVRGLATYTQPAYDVTQAQKLLDEAGIVDSNHNGTRDYHGQELSFKYYLKADHGSADSMLIAQSIQQDLKALQIELQLLPSGNFGKELTPV